MSHSPESSGGLATRLCQLWQARQQQLYGRLCLQTQTSQNCAAIWRLWRSAPPIFLIFSQALYHIHYMLPCLWAAACLPGS